jgi:hypothetical protein
MTTELIFSVTIRGNVTPEQWHRLTTGDRAIVRTMEDLFRETLNAHRVEIRAVRRAGRGVRGLLRRTRPLGP